MEYVIAIDQSTSSTKAMLFDAECRMISRCNVDHRQYYPQTGWVEHDAEEIYNNMVEAIRGLIVGANASERWNSQLSKRSEAFAPISIAITNQRETVVVWDRDTGCPVSRAVVWQDTRGKELCQRLREEGHERMVMERAGLLIDPNFSATAVAWLLDNIEGCRERAEKGGLLLGTIDTWLIWKLTKGKVHATDITNASRTMLFNIHTMEWNDELLSLFNIPRQMLPQVLPCDAVYGETTVEGLFREPIKIAGVLGDSHGALVGQMCFGEGMGKVTYGTGSSVMVNVGKQPIAPPQGLVTSVAFSALGQHFYGFEGNIYSTGATLKWLCDQVHLIGSPKDMEAEATSVESSGGVYIVPAFSGLGAPWWRSDVRGAIFGLTFATTRAHLLRAALESIALQVKDLIDAITQRAGIKITSLAADGGPTSNKFMMQLQATLLQADIICTDIEDASALGAAIMNGFALRRWQSFSEVEPLRNITKKIAPQQAPAAEQLYKGWLNAVAQLTK